MFLEATAVVGHPSDEVSELCDSVLKPRSRTWLQYARRQDLAHLPPRQIYSSYRLCSAHFTSRDYADPGQTRLLRCAVLTVSVFGDWQTHVESPGSPLPANTTAMPAHSADEEVQQTEPSSVTRRTVWNDINTAVRVDQKDEGSQQDEKQGDCFSTKRLQRHRAIRR
ncbi:hypothetical protein HPB51_024149 [Rhipicephalus microplus]|uniref:THAP-type domain-containing protein n=1 Tax=Rhipicephalus microplus TaxID=6941 RepID=A0A9J6DK85_RHIMP|nr:hypothetical protein HPB51_024149 [Rhipicephalus microplus]